MNLTEIQVVMLRMALNERARNLERDGHSASLGYRQLAELLKQAKAVELK